MDVIVIGSGVGGLVLAALCAKLKGLRVLVLEAHQKAGGFTHTFSRRGHVFDVGVHYVGGLRPGAPIAQVFATASEGRLKWKSLPFEFDRLYFSNEQFQIPADPLELERRLVTRFPEEKMALIQYFKDVPRFARAYHLWQMREVMSGFVAGPVGVYLQTRYLGLFRRTQEELNRRFKDSRLKDILSAQWGGFGLPPERSSFGFHCVHVDHYAKGGWYPEGGGEKIAEALLPTFLNRGGEIRTSSRVSEILIENGRAVGVRLESGEIIQAPVVVSDAGAAATYSHLLPHDFGFRDIHKKNLSPTAFVVYLGLKTSPRTLGFQDSNYWLFNDQDYPIYLSFPSLKRDLDRSTAEIMQPIHPEQVERWQGTRWQDRGEDYEKFKADLAEKLIARVDQEFPGFKNEVKFTEASTPLSVTHFQHKSEGEIFGLPATPERLRSAFARSGTPIENLFLTGSDCFSSGIGGAAAGALKTFQIMTQSKNWRHSLQILESVLHNQ